MAPAVLFRDAVSLAGRFPLLSGLSLEVAEGEVVHLRGPNGAGKSSFLRCCAGLAALSGGEAWVLGHDLRADRQSLRREVGLLGHASFLYQELSVEENLRFAVRAARSPLAGIEPALSRLGLEGRLRRSAVGRLSAGQRRRVSIAVLLARSPRLWLLDEPHAGLDADARELLDVLVDEARQRGATVVLASHELDRAGELADRVVELAGGRALGEPAGSAEVPPAGAGLAVPAGRSPGPAVTLPPAGPAGEEEVGCDVA
ncbi:MAG TPA: heme ABC exporter ATP-binding protein CcmA [Acidimicrobiales bacterium]|nr:heme ABC exporter ATP-binding protein CcmA [Acidimicrobiales bacterium]